MSPLVRRLADVVRANEAYGRSTEGGGERVVVEFVSANPTGPLHVGHGRQAALGDAIAALLEATGWSVSREFYYNDAGAQVENLVASVRARVAERPHPLAIAGPGRLQPRPGDRAGLCPVGRAQASEPYRRSFLPRSS